MSNLIYLPEFWIGAAVGGISILLLLILWLIILGLTDEAAELSDAESEWLERNSRPSFQPGSNRNAPTARKPAPPANPPHPRPWPGSTNSAGPGGGHAPYHRTARSEMRSQLR